MTSLSPEKEKICAEAIVEQIEAGAKAWVTAGRAISEMRRRDPGCYAKLLALRPWLTPKILETMERIGSRQLYPYVMLESSFCASRLLNYTYEAQVDACTKGVEVLLYYKNGKPMKQIKAISNLSRQEAKQVFGPHRCRSAEEQLPYLPMEVGRSHNAGGGPKRLENVTVTSTPAETEALADQKSVGLFKLTIDDEDQADIEPVSVVPPGCQIVNIEQKGSRRVAWLKVVERVASVGQSEIEKKWLAFKNENQKQEQDGE